MDDRFGAGFRLQAAGQGEIAHADARQRVLCQSEGIDPGLCQGAGALHGGADVEPFGNFELDGDDRTRPPGVEKAAFGQGGRLEPRRCRRDGRRNRAAPAGATAAQGFGQGPHVFRAGAAAAADQAGAGCGHVAAEGGNVVGGRQVEDASVDPLREAGVGKGRERSVGDCRQAAQDLQQFAWPGPAVGADGGRGCGCQLPRRLFDAEAVAGEPPLDEGQLGNRRQVEFPGDLQREQQIGYRGEGLQQEAVDPPLGQRRHLLAIHRPAAGGVQFQLAAARQQQRPDRSGDQALRASGFPGQPRPGAVDGDDLALQAKSGQAQGIGAEGVGLQQFGAGGRVVGMHPADPLGVDQVEILEDGIRWCAAVVELGAHAAVADDDRAVLQPLKQQPAALGDSHGLASRAAGSVTSRNWRRMAAVSPQIRCSPKR